MCWGGDLPAQILPEHLHWTYHGTSFSQTRPQTPSWRDVLRCVHGEQRPTGCCKKRHRTVVKVPRPVRFCFFEHSPVSCGSAPITAPSPTGTQAGWRVSWTPWGLFLPFYRGTSFTHSQIVQLCRGCKSSRQFGKSLLRRRNHSLYSSAIKLPLTIKRWHETAPRGEKESVNRMLQ